MRQLSELDRIRKEYARRGEDRRLSRLYTYFDPANLFILQSREREVLRLLDKHGFNPLTDYRVLDVGCGVGGELRNLLQYGARPENLFGAELLPNRLDDATELSPQVGYVCADAAQLPYRDESFDLVMQFTVFTSVLDEGMRIAIAKEMLRVLKPSGAILWYDFWASNPKNPAVRGVGLSEIKRLFPDCIYDFRRITLAPPIARRLASRSVLLCSMLERMSPLCTHYLGLLKKLPHKGN